MNRSLLFFIATGLVGVTAVAELGCATAELVSPQPLPACDATNDCPVPKDASDEQTTDAARDAADATATDATDASDTGARDASDAGDAGLLDGDAAG